MAPTGSSELRCRIDRIEVENFKSYRGFQVIGPMKDFTAVIGPNGSGKSNLMDAISFVLGVRTAHLRGSLKELIYSNSVEKNAEPLTCFVRLVLVNDKGAEITFERSIVANINAQGEEVYSSKSKHNGRAVSLEEYDNRLQEFGILVKARNFLVFQGDIESIASMSAKDLTGLFEQISGSAVLKGDYETAERAKQEAEEKQMLLFSKKKSVLAEKRQKKEQKEEAEKHIKAQEELRVLRQEYFLWRLHGLDSQVSKAEADKAEILQEQRATASALVEAEARLKKLEKQAAAHKKAVIVASKKVAAKAAEMDKHKPEVTKLGEQRSRLAKNIKKAEKHVQDLRKKQAEHEAAIASLNKDMKAVERLQKQFEEGASAEGGGEGISMEEEVLEEYNRCKEEAGAQTVRLRSDLERLEAERKTAEDDKDRIGSQISNINSRLHVIQARNKESEDKRKSLQTRVAEVEAQLAEKKAALQQVHEKHMSTKTRRQKLTAELEDVEGRIREAKADRKESEKEKRMREAVRSMQDAMPGVQGRLADLGKVTQRRYNLALAMAMNKDMDAVVCDDEQVAKQCIQFLKDQRIPPMTFIPLATISAKPVNEQLRAAQGRHRLAIDCIEYDPKFERAFLYALGNCLIADTIEEARSLAYSPERHKVVSLDGTVFNRAGLITGGLSRDAQSRAGRWDDRAVGQLRDKRDALAAQLDALQSERALAEEQQGLESDVRKMEEQRTGAVAELRATEERLGSMAQESKALTASRKSLVPELQQVRKLLVETEKKIETLRNQQNEVTDKVFEAFSKKVGVASIREYEETRLQQQMQAAEKRAQYKTQMSKLMSQLEYEEGRLLKCRDDMAKAEASLASDREAADKLEKQGAKAEEALASVRKVVEDLQMEEAEAKAAASGVSKEMAEIKKNIAAADKEGKEAMRQVKDKEELIADLRRSMAEVVQQAQMDNVPLPKAPKKGRGRRGREEEDDDAMEVDGEEEGVGGAIDGEGTWSYDYSKVRRQYLAQAGKSKMDAIDKEFQESIKALTSQLEQLVPNLKALEQYEAVRDVERQHNEQLEEAKSAVKAATAEFNRVQQERLTLFMDAFEHVSRSIDQIYKELTRSDVHVYGGTAYLALEAPENPFAGGVKYTAMPPSKRFREMELLSGGEKTVAALALLFAIHSFRPSPFFVLDEVDAALDASNIAKVASYIQQRSRAGAQGRVQSIVISLKDAFFDKADALVGVTKDLQEQSSAIFTFDLSRFPE